MAKRDLHPVLTASADDLPDGDELPEGPELGVALAAFHPLAASLAAAVVPFSGATGEQVLGVARQHLGEAYVFGARAPMGNATWTGPWDCAELVSWCVYRASGILFGTEPRSDPMLADAFTGYWFEQALASGALIDWREAAGIAGAAVLRRPTNGQVGHIVVSDGQGGTVEAHSSQRGVIAGTLSNRRWDWGILVPGIRYLRSSAQPALLSTAATLHLTSPLTQGDGVRAVQRRLIALGLMAGEVDGTYGPQTAHAVRAFQARAGLVADGEAGALTLAALGLTAS